MSLPEQILLTIGILAPIGIGFTVYCLALRIDAIERRHAASDAGFRADLKSTEKEITP